MGRGGEVVGGAAPGEGRGGSERNSGGFLVKANKHIGGQFRGSFAKLDALKFKALPSWWFGARRCGI